MTQYTLQQKFFLLLLALVTVAFVYILLPYSGAIFWGVVLAILFAPLYRRLLRQTKQKPNLAALLTLLLIVVMVILPVSLISASLVKQAAGIYEMVNSGQINVGAYFQRVLHALPQWVVNLLARFDLTDLASLQQKLAEGAAQVSQTVARQALAFGSKTFDFLVGMFVLL
jgi:predicted PurR-regulated permease PerM